MIFKIALVYAAISGALGVALGAFGAHGLRGQLEDRLMSAFETAVQYQLLHSIALLLIVLLAGQLGRSLAFQISAGAMMLGILLFSGSIYGLVLTSMKWLGPVTPLGGVCFIAGWIALAIGGWQSID